MDLPTFDLFIEPLLRHLARHPDGLAAGAESIVLVQGTRLAQLMIDHEVGVSLKPRYIPELDGDYFEQL